MKAVGNMWRLACALAIGGCLIPSIAHAGAYSTRVQSLNPTHYYQLDETLKGTVTDIGSTPINGTHDFQDVWDGAALPPDPDDPSGRGGLVFGGTPEDPALGLGWIGAPAADETRLINRVGPPMDLPIRGFDSTSRSLFGNNSVNVELGPSADFRNPTMTVAFWFKAQCDANDPGVSCDGPPASSGGERMFTNNFAGTNTGGDTDIDDLGHLQIDYGWGADLVISIDNRFSDPLKSNFQINRGKLLTKNESWHHIVVSRNGDRLENVILVLDGVNITQDQWENSTDSWGITAPEVARIGGRSPTSSDPSGHTFNGWLDEMAIWLGRQLTPAEGRSLYLAGLNIGSDLNADGGVDAADAGIMFSSWGSATDPIADINADMIVDAADAGAMFSTWTGDPGAVTEGTAAAEYNAVTGVILVSANNVVNWYVQSASNSLNGSPLRTTDLGAGLKTDNHARVGETALSPLSYTNANLGPVAATGLSQGDLTIYWNSRLGGQLESAPVAVVPEPAAGLLTFCGLLSCLALRRRS